MAEMRHPPVPYWAQPLTLCCATAPQPDETDHGCPPMEAMRSCCQAPVLPSTSPAWKHHNSANTERTSALQGCDLCTHTLNSGNSFLPSSQTFIRNADSGVKTSVSCLNSVTKVSSDSFGDSTGDGAQHSQRSSASMKPVLLIARNCESP